MEDSFLSINNRTHAKGVASQTPNNKTCRVGWGRQGCCLSNTCQQDMPGGVGSTRMLPLKHLTTRHAGRGGVGKDVASQTPTSKTCREGCCLSNTYQQDMPGGVGSTRMLPLKHLPARHAGRGGVDKDVASQTLNNKTCRAGWGRQGCCLSNT